MRPRDANMTCYDCRWIHFLTYFNQCHLTTSSYFKDLKKCLKKYPNLRRRIHFLSSMLFFRENNHHHVFVRYRQGVAQLLVHIYLFVVTLDHTPCNQGRSVLFDSYT